MARGPCVARADSVGDGGLEVATVVALAVGVGGAWTTTSGPRVSRRNTPKAMSTRATSVVRRGRMTVLRCRADAWLLGRRAIPAQTRACRRRARGARPRLPGGRAGLRSRVPHGIPDLDQRTTDGARPLGGRRRDLGGAIARGAARDGGGTGPDAP